MTHRLIDYLRQHHRLLISEMEAERIIGATPQQVVVAQGRDCDSGIPRTHNLESDEVLYAIEEPD